VSFDPPGSPQDSCRSGTSCPTPALLAGRRSQLGWLHRGQLQLQSCHTNHRAVLTWTARVAMMDWAWIRDSLPR
jgi:hypothetical protein